VILTDDRAFRGRTHLEAVPGIVGQCRGDDPGDDAGGNDQARRSLDTEVSLLSAPHVGNRHGCGKPRGVIPAAEEAVADHSRAGKVDGSFLASALDADAGILPKRRRRGDHDRRPRVARGEADQTASRQNRKAARSGVILYLGSGTPPGLAGEESMRATPLCTYTRVDVDGRTRVHRHARDRRLTGNPARTRRGWSTSGATNAESSSSTRA